MIKRLALAVAFAVAFIASAGAAAPNVDLGSKDGVIELRDDLAPYKGPTAKPDAASSWYSFTAVNSAKEPTTRVLRAGQPPGLPLSLRPVGRRPTILQVETTAPGATIERSNAYGRNGFRITLPAGATVPLAIRMTAGQEPPSLLAWTEPSLAAHNRQIAIFIAAIAGLIGAAAAIAAGLALMTHHMAPRWAAISLFFVLLARLAAIGLFDGSLVTRIGGPYGLTALFAGLALAAGLKFADVVAPVEAWWSGKGRYVHWGIYGLLAVSAFAYLGIPGATLLTNILLFVGIAAVLVYFIYRGRRGCQPARVLTPSASLFMLLAIGTAFAALGGFGNTSLSPDFAGGFAAAGAVLLALAVAAGEGVAVPFVRHAAAVAAAPVAVAPVPTEDHPAVEAIGASRQGVFQLDFADSSVTLSPEAASLLGFGTEWMGRDDWAALIHADDRAVYQQAIEQFRVQSGQAFRIEFRVRAGDGRYSWCELRATMKGPESGAAERCVGLLADVTVRKESEAELMDRTLRDPLTGLGNRVALMEELEKLGARFRDATFAVLDIDRFKTIHASLGDRGGDNVLLGIAERLTRRFQSIGQVFRVGGDAFAVLVRKPNPNPSDFGAELVHACEGAHKVEDRDVFAPASVGIAQGGTARDPIDLLKNAGLALIQAKRQGGDCARVYTPDMEALAPADAVALETELRRALDAGEIDVFYQPIVRLADRTVAGFEALLRWRHPAKGLVSPADFIAHSEETGLIVALGRLALTRAAKDLAQWQRYFPLAEPLFVSVNLSRRQMRDAAFAEEVAQLLSHSGLAAGSLRLEITESTVASDADIQALMARLRSLGAGLAIDDFGTGMSSLSQLAALPFDSVKIDKSFLSRHGGADLDSDNGDVVLSTIVTLAHDLKRSVIVEGVESEADAKRVAEIGCEYAQGFLFSEPMTMQDTLGYIARRFRAATDLQRGSGAAGVSG